MSWNAKDWAFAKTNDPPEGPMWMDDLHVQTIYEIIMATQPKRVLEIGCYWGYSSSAIVQAKIDGWEGHSLHVDTEIRDQLIAVLRRGGKEWSVAQITGVKALQRLAPGDLVIVDGDHSDDNVRLETNLILDQGWKSVIAHDVAGGVHEPGPPKMLERLRSYPSWRVLVDSLERPGTATHRGLMYATPRSPWFHEVLEIWDRLGLAERDQA
jgi:predicted O-methyltransferase YrrM